MDDSRAGALLVQMEGVVHAHVMCRMHPLQHAEVPRALSSMQQPADAMHAHFVPREAGPGCVWPLLALLACDAFDCEAVRHC